MGYILFNLICGTQFGRLLLEIYSVALVKVVIFCCSQYPLSYIAIKQYFLLGCSFTKGEDEDCVENCDKTVLCNKSFFKQCETGKYIEQMCPSDVRLKRINFCDDGNFS